eukprot:151670_1
MDPMSLSLTKPNIKIDQYKEGSTWFNACVTLKNVDLKNESFTIKSFFNIYWISYNLENYRKRRTTIESKNEQKIDDSSQIDIDLLALFDNDKKKQYEDIIGFGPNNKTPIKTDGKLNWFFQNETEEPTVHQFKISYIPIQIPDSNIDKKHNKAVITILDLCFEGTFHESFELKNFPFDAQFLNLKLKFDPLNYTFLSNCPQWLLDLIKVKVNYKQEWHHERAMSIGITDPATKEWDLLEPWIDFRANPNTLLCLIRMRVKRKPIKYILNNVIPLILITGLSFIYIFMGKQDMTDKLAFVVTLLLTIAAGRSELVPDMPDNSDPTTIDVFILIGYVIFALEMVSIAINDAIGDNQCNENIDNCLEFVVLIFCIVIWFIGICYLFVYKWCRKLGPDFWEKRSNVEFKSWSSQQIIESHVHITTILGSDMKAVERMKIKEE